MGCNNSKEKKEPEEAPQRTRSTLKPRPKQKSSTPAAANSPAHYDDAPTNTNRHHHNNEGGARTPPSTGGNNNNHSNNYRSLKQVVLDAEEVLRLMSIPEEEKKLVALSFINTLIDVLRQSRLKKDSVMEAIEELCADPSITIHRSVLGQATHGAREEFLSHLITSWVARNPTGEPTLPSEVANAILLENQITPWKNVPMRFGDCYRELLRIGDNSFTNAVFSKYAEGNLTISSQQFLNFLVDCQHSDTATMKMAEEKTKERFGAVGTRFTFALYLQSLTLNAAEDPRRSGTVWQDMTQPLPEYMVRTSLVDTIEDLRCSLAMGNRAIVLHCFEEEEGCGNSIVMAGDATFDSMLQVIKEEGFTASNYPLMLCLAPEVTLTVSLQDRIAKSLLNILGEELLAKGMMFEGGTIRDPKFSPAALQHRVLVLGSQAPLKPFVGFLVADMNRNGLGVKVTNVVAQTPAAKAGVQKGDWFTHINNEPITSKSHLKSILAKLQLGEEFTMRRENLDDVSIVVGGFVEGDAINSKELSNLVFLKFTNEKSQDNSHWDICVVDESNSSGKVNGTNTDKNNAADPENNRSLAAEAVSRGVLANYFRFTTLKNPPQIAVSEATHSGVQLICSSRSVTDQTWSRGFFADNGACGYIQKSFAAPARSAKGFRIQLECPPPHFYNWSFAGLRAQIFGEGSITVDEDRRLLEITGTDDLAVCSFLVTFMPPCSGGASSSDASPARVNAALPTSPNKAQADAIAQPVVLSVTFPVAILRQGIRAFASVEEKNEGKLRTMPHYPILSEILAIA